MRGPLGGVLPICGPGPRDAGPGEKRAQAIGFYVKRKYMVVTRVLPTATSSLVYEAAACPTCPALATQSSVTVRVWMGCVCLMALRLGSDIQRRKISLSSNPIPPQSPLLSHGQMANKVK
jgi:hypothetical protein